MGSLWYLLLGLGFFLGCGILGGLRDTVEILFLIDLGSVLGILLLHCKENNSAVHNQEHSHAKITTR